MADEEVEVQEPDEKDLIIKALEEKIMGHKKFQNTIKAVLEPFVLQIMKDLVPNLEIKVKEK